MLFKCEICNKELSSAGSLHNHMRIHTGERTCVCTFCARTFLTVGQLEVHERSHTHEKPFVCTVCGKGFSYRQSLITHNTLHTGIKPYLCENCKKTFSCVGNLIKHKRSRADSCGLIPGKVHRLQNVATKLRLSDNMITSSKIKTNLEQKDLQLNEKPVLDTDTDKSFIHEPNSQILASDIVLDAENINDDVKIGKNCSLDEKSSIFQNNLDKNFETSINDNQTFAEATEQVSYECKYCKRIFQNACWLLKHESRHKNGTIEQFIKCPNCKETFTSKLECREHALHHHKDILTCNVCDRSFSSRDSLKQHHKIIHTGIPRKTYIYICQKCGSKFKARSKLQFHEDNNCTSELHYECEICKKRFGDRHVMLRHRRIHKNEKNYLCKHCGKGYHWKSQLQIHERNHSGEKPFKCSYCSKSFNYRDSLRTHSTMHTGVKPYVCEACGSRFSCIGNLKKHHVAHDNCMSWCKANRSNKKKYKWLDD